jgi:hypothetical protein
MTDLRIFSTPLEEVANHTPTQRLSQGTKMTTNEVLEIFEQKKPAPAITEYERAQQAIRSNFERLKFERLAREAAASK